MGVAKQLTTGASGAMSAVGFMVDILIQLVGFQNCSLVGGFNPSETI